MRVWTRLGVAAAAATPLLLLAAPAHAASPGASWSMEDPTVMTDVSGNGNTGTQLKSITSAPGFSGNGYHFVQGSLVTVPDSDTLDPGTADISITVHVKFDKVPDPKTVGDYDLIRKGLAATPGGEWKIEIFPPSGSTTVAPAFCLFKDAAKNVANIRGSKNLADNQWHTITCTKTSSSVRLVVDGGATETKTLNKALGSISNNQPVGIGQKPEVGGGDQYVGDMDEVTIDIGSITSGGEDTTRPTVTGKSPAPSATGVSTATPVAATFSEAVQATTVSKNTFKLKRSGTSTVLPATVTYDPGTLTATLQPSSPLAAGTKYTANLTTGIKDPANNTLVATSWTFTTGSTGGGDSTRPTVTSRSPAPSATGVSRTTAVTATFSEAVHNLTTKTFKLKKSGTSTAVRATVTYDPTTMTATLQPNAALTARTKYTATLTAGIKDAVNLALKAISWTFRTV